MQHTLRIMACDDRSILLEERVIAYGLVSGYDRSAAELGVPAGSLVRMELLDRNGQLLAWRTYLVPVAGRRVPAMAPQDAAPAEGE